MVRCTVQMVAQDQNIRIKGCIILRLWSLTRSIYNYGPIQYWITTAKPGNINKSWLNRGTMTCVDIIICILPYTSSPPYKHNVQIITLYFLYEMYHFKSNNKYIDITSCQFDSKVTWLLFSYTCIIHWHYSVQINGRGNALHQWSSVLYRVYVLHRCSVLSVLYMKLAWFCM